MFWCFGHEACEILAPQPGIKLVPSALEGDILTTEPPWKCQLFENLIGNISVWNPIHKFAF